jgi:hypothetical protein
MASIYTVVDAYRTCKTTWKPFIYIKMDSYIKVTKIGKKILLEAYNSTLIRTNNSCKYHTEELAARCYIHVAKWTANSQNRQWFVGWLVYSCCSHLVHRTFVKFFASLQFLNLRHSVGLLGRVISPSQGRYLTETHNKHRHQFLEWDSNPRSRGPSEQRHFMS